jgi:hypothetical protein
VVSLCDLDYHFEFSDHYDLDCVIWPPHNNFFMYTMSNITACYNLYSVWRRDTLFLIARYFFLGLQACSAKLIAHIGA